MPLTLMQLCSDNCPITIVDDNEFGKERIYSSCNFVDGVDVRFTIVF